MQTLDFARALDKGNPGTSFLMEVAMDPFAIVFPAIVAIFIVGLVAGGLAALRQTRNARRDRMEMKRHLRNVGLTGR
jgi:hypothetical protein